ncbi:type I-B CRISPR-associated protein Cas5 [candidate division KSB1 bacterium]|nr:type I-B CRISPR-associated protein Cas5 [candidate division KSB1 bacterium]
MNKLLVFDVWADYAHFRTYYTTSSPLSFGFPPKPTLYGLISAIIGLEKEENDYLRYFQNSACRMAVCISSRLRKVRWTINLINTKDQRGDSLFLPIKKGAHAPRTQIRTEFVKDPRYRIYFQHQNEAIYQKLKDNLHAHTAVYTPVFGLSELLANFQYVAEVEATEKQSADWIELHSIVPESTLANERAVDLNPETELFQVMVPMEMTPERIVTRYERVFFERLAKPHKYQVTRYWETSDGKNIILF